MTTKNKTIYPPRDLYTRPTAYPQHTPAAPMMSTRQRPVMDTGGFSSPQTQAEFSSIPRPAPSKFKELLDEYQSKYGELNTPMMSTRQRPVMDTEDIYNPKPQAKFSSRLQQEPSKFKELLDEYQSKYGTPGSSMMSMKEGYGRYGSNNTYPEYNALEDPMFIEKARQVRQKNTRQDWQATGANKLAKFMYTNPIGRAPGFVFQGVADAGLNPLGYGARYLGLDTRPLEPRNFHERALENISREAYNSYALWWATQATAAALPFLGGVGSKFASPLLSKYPALQKMGTQAVKLSTGTPQKILKKGQKIFNAVTRPDIKSIPLQSLATGGSEALFNPQTEYGKYLADVGGLLLLGAKNPLKAGIRTLPKTLLKKSSKQVVKKIAKKSKTLLKTPPKQLAKTLIQNPKVQEFGENVIIGEGAKRIIANILDPRSEMNSKARSLRKEDNSKSREAVPSLLPYNPLSNLHLNLMGIPSYSQIKFTQKLLEPLFYDRRINGGVHR